jgi:hypothetical protein
MKNLENLVAEYADLTGKTYGAAEAEVMMGVKLAARKLGFKMADLIKKIENMDEDMGAGIFMAMIEDLRRQI